MIDQEEGSDGDRVKPRGALSFGSNSAREERALTAF